jgi:hypothetical protein
MRTFASLVGVDLGFDTRNLFLANVSFPPGQPASPAAKLQFERNSGVRSRFHSA